MRGAGGTEGGVLRFVMGLVMFVGGIYLLLQAITVNTSFGFGYSLWRGGGVRLTTGMVLIPFIFGVGMVFYNAKSIVGWGLAATSLVILVFGVISSIRFTIRHMSAFDFLMILTLAVGGIGLVLSSLRNLSAEAEEP